jgi:chemotaxis protein MotB
MGSIRDALGVTVVNPGEYQAKSTTPIEISEIENKELTPLEEDAQPPQEAKSITVDQEEAEMLREVDEFIEERELDGVVEAMPGERGITIRVKDGLMFPSASDSLRDEAAPVFSEIAELTRMHPEYQLSVEGYTDDVPIHTQRFPSNWELSAARAVAGVRHLIEHGQVDPERLNAAGFAHTRPVSPGSSAVERGRNRRLEFVFYREEKDAMAELFGP